MPHTHHDSANRPANHASTGQPADAAKLPQAPLAATRYRLNHHDPGGLSAPAACLLVAHYTRAGELVADIDASPLVMAAADWLDRDFTARPHRYPEHGHHAPALLFTRLPRPEATDPSEMAEWMRTCRMMLAPGGHLVAVVSPDPGERVDHAATVVTAASIAGLRAVPPPWRGGTDLDGVLVFEVSHG